MKVKCENYNHVLADTLVSHLHVNKLKSNEDSMVVALTKSLVKLKNILLILMENNEDNVTTIKQVYNVRYEYIGDHIENMKLKLNIYSVFGWGNLRE